MTEATADKKKKAGRPQGAETKDRDVRTAVITCDPCPACGSKDAPKNKRLLRQGDATATVNGVLCGSFKHYTADCPDCGKAFLYREFKAVK